MSVQPLPKSNPSPIKFDNRGFILLLVVMLHLGALWALQSGAFKPTKPAEVVIPITLKPIQPLQPTQPPTTPNAHSTPAKSLQVETAPPQARAQPKPQSSSQVVATQAEVATTALPPTVAVTSTKAIDTAATSADSVSATKPVAAVADTPSSAASSTNITLDSATASNTAPAAKLAKVHAPSADADYTYSRKPKRSSQSEKMGEFGRVLIYTMIGSDGVLLDAKIEKSSGFPRLDSTALEAVRTWRFKPGTVEGVPTALPYLIPITFEP